MKLKNIILGIVAIVMIVAITVGITVAYLTDTDTAENKMTIGDVDIALREYERVSVDTPNASEEAQVQKFNDNKPLLPAVLGKEFDYAEKGASVKWDVDKDGNPIKLGYTSTIWEPADVNNEVDKMVFVENVGMGEAYVRVFFAFEAGNYTSFTRFQDMIHINLNDTASEWKWEWNPALATSTNGGKYFIASATYQPILEPKQFTTISLSQIMLDPTATNDDVLAFGEKYEISVFVQGIQKVGFETAEEAVDEGFGDEIPFKDLTFETGVKLKIALHYLNGEESEDKKITANVSTVTFGLNKDHKNITSKYNPTFIGSEQDVAVYSYYVKNDAGKYDIYVLADSKIYPPKDSTGLFQNMTSLTTVDTTNMDVSRTEDMTYMFRNCPQLTTIDTSKWNTTKTQSFKGTFWECSSLAELDVSGWNTSNVTNMYCMFFSCSAIDGLDVSKWDVSQVTNMAYMFDRCPSITSLNVTNWDVGKVTTFKQFLHNETTNGLTSLDVSKWNTESATDMSFMFAGCMNIESLDVSNWDVSKVTTFASFLQSLASAEGGMAIKEIKGIERWNTSSATDMSFMFYGCTYLEKLDLRTNSDTGAWNVSNVTNMRRMLASCQSLVTVNIKGWNTTSVNNTQEMFYNAKALKTIYVSDGFDMSNIEDSDKMFYVCPNLVGQNGTTVKGDFIDATYARVDGGEYAPGYFTVFTEEAAPNNEQN